MILHLEGKVNRYYVQTLCMIFFPGATFSADETSQKDVPEVDVHVYPDADNSCTAYVSIRLNDRFSEATATVSYAQEVSIADHESIAVGRAMLDAGKHLLGYIPPWGILTGIRPAKVARSLLDNGCGILRTKRILRDEYFLHPQKAALATAVAVNEGKILQKLPPDTCSLYVSIPFCPTRCAYCSFVSYTNAKLLSLIDDYLAALLADIDETFAVIRAFGLSVRTVYIGGGTPSILSAEQLTLLLSSIRAHLTEDEAVEFTVEAGRPDTITPEKLSVAKTFGVTRVSVNPQILNDEILKQIGRKHTVADFYRAYDMAKNSGIRDINVDLIAGLPGNDFADFSKTVDSVIALMPSNITVHTFCVKKAADVLRRNEQVYSLSGADAGKSVSYAQIQTKFAGYKPYYMYRQKNTVGNLENVGYSLEGHEGLYNIYMMEEAQTIFAVGAGAVTKLCRRDSEGEMHIRRIFKPKYPYEYLRQTAEERQKDLYAQVSAFFAGEPQKG